MSGSDHRNIQRMEEIVLGWKYEQWVKDCVLENEVICPNHRSLASNSIPEEFLLQP